MSIIIRAKEEIVRLIEPQNPGANQSDIVSKVQQASAILEQHPELYKDKGILNRVFTVSRANPHPTLRGIEKVLLKIHLCSETKEVFVVVEDKELATQDELDSQIQECGERLGVICGERLLITENQIKSFTNEAFWTLIEKNEINQLHRRFT